MEAITALLEDLDLEKLIPEMDSLLGTVEKAVRIAILIGPILMLVLGLIYLLIPPKEANHHFGFRTFWGMGSVEAWRFTQMVAGISWSVIGLVLSIVMYVISKSLPGKEPMDMVILGTTCLVWQVIIAFSCCVIIGIVAFIFFDRKGIPRRSKR